MLSAEDKQAVINSLLPRLLVINQLLVWAFYTADGVVDPLIDNVKHDLDAIRKDVDTAMRRLREGRPA